MTLLKEKEILIEKISSTLRQMNNLLPDSPIIGIMEQLQSDLLKEYYTIVVVGEFKHGKSTLVNALLGEALMPTDVTPTTALIHAVFHGEEREMHIVKQDGEVEKRKLTSDALSDYIVSADSTSSDINHIKVFLPSELLKNNVVLVDTPGLNDLNQHRSAITKQFIPQADAVLFTLDMRAPVNQTEYDFLEKVTKEEGIRNILFAANFIDRMDDDEEIEEVKTYIERRLGTFTPGQLPVVLPLSAKEGLEAKETKNPELFAHSGLETVENAIQRLLEKSNRQAEKMERYQFRMKALHRVVLAEIVTVKAVYEADRTELEDLMESLSNWINNKNQWATQLDVYVKERQQEIQMIIEKSIFYFVGKLKKEVSNRIEMFNGSDIDHLVSTELPLMIQTRFEQWVDQYNSHMQELFGKLEREVSKGLSESFKQHVVVQTKERQELLVGTSTGNVEVQSVNTLLRAGLVVGGASSIALLLGASIIVPVMGMVALPFLQAKMMKSKLGKTKPSLHRAMEDNIEEITIGFVEQVNRYISTNIAMIQHNTQHQFETQLENRKNLIDDQLFEKTKENGQLNKKIDQFNHLASEVKKIIGEVE